MKIEIANIETDVKTVKDLRQALKDAKDAMVSAEQGTEEYNKALKQTANIQHELREMQTEINANADDFGQKMGNVSKTLAGVAGGVTAVTGAMSLLGIENEEATKKITATMTSLLGITKGLAKIDDGIKGFTRLTKAISGSSGTLGKFKVALIGTGLGALVVLLGSVIANWEEFTEAIGVSDEMLTSFGDKLQGVFNVFKEGTARIAQTVGKLLKGDFAGIKEIWSDFSIVESYNAGVEKAVKDRNDAIAAENKKAADEAAKLRKEQLDKEIADRKNALSKDLDSIKSNNNKEIVALKEKYAKGLIAEEEYQQELQKLKEEELNNELTRLQEQLKNEKLTADERIEIEKQVISIRGQLLDEELKKQAAAKKKVADEQKAIEADQNDLKKFIENYQNKSKTEQELLDQDYKAKQALAHEDKELLLQLEKWYQEESKRLTEEGEKAKKEITLQMGLETADGIASIMNSIASAMDTSNEKQFKAKQAMEIASATINTITGSIKAYMSAWDTYGSIPFVGSGLATAFSVVQAATVAAAGAAQIATIARQKYKGGSGSSGSAGRMSASPSINTAALSAASRPVDSVRTVQGASEEAAIKDTRVYVLESDITDTQNRVKTVESESKF